MLGSSSVSSNSGCAFPFLDIGELWNGIPGKKCSGETVPEEPKEAARIFVLAIWFPEASELRHIVLTSDSSTGPH